MNAPDEPANTGTMDSLVAGYLREMAN